MTILHTRGPSQRSNKRSKPSPNADTDGTGDACCCNDVLSSSPDAQGVSNRRFAPPFPQPSPRWIPSAERRSAVQREAGGRHVAPLRNARLEEAGEDGFERPSSTARHASASGGGLSRPPQSAASQSRASGRAEKPLQPSVALSLKSPILGRRTPL
eukprot:CAMPEP_0181205488 /NCGR_PEP_ID=MMETSP1096-20121128/20505_1 /TAXON_ID=156174 ORGANISM="Chrysochromulina ericina, Strain CCMP281" /NCGR_SAMPLE_ID=MMETSP1096 /ASSEMBLY_ACC=CAM_ASM_000453 /LENGTH=155 /DNA_ID=CAMNT_0023296277 /DNA_START=262 /DNA_END=727 /DNA_ORIENTATION=+